MSDPHNKDFDEEPVFYCTECYSLSIKHEDAINMDCCAECGCSDIAQTTIEEWEKLYARRYGHKFVVKNQDPTNSIIFKMSLNEIKNKVFENPLWRTIVYSLYPSFPGGLNREDSLILFFDKIMRDDRLKDLKLYLYKNFNY